MEWLSFINSEVHKALVRCSARMRRRTPKQYARKNLAIRLTTWSVSWDRRLPDGRAVHHADGYLFTVLSWGQHVTSTSASGRSSSASSSAWVRGRMSSRRQGRGQRTSATRHSNRERAGGCRRLLLPSAAVQALHVKDAMATKLNKQLKREIDVDGKPFMVTLSPEGLKPHREGQGAGTLSSPGRTSSAGMPPCQRRLNASVGQGVGTGKR